MLWSDPRRASRSPESRQNSPADPLHNNSRTRAAIPLQISLPLFLAKKVHNRLRNPIWSHIKGPLLNRVVMIMGDTKRTIDASM